MALDSATSTNVLGSRLALGKTRLSFFELHIPAAQPGNGAEPCSVGAFERLLLSQIVALPAEAQIDDGSCRVCLSGFGQAGEQNRSMGSVIADVSQRSCRVSGM